VADFIGSLNVFDLTVGEHIGDYAVARFADDQRIVVAAPAKPGDSLRVSVRPEQVQIAQRGAAGSDGGSRLDGTIAEIVYLGMYTQFHVDTAVGRLVSHRLGDEPLAHLASGSQVSLSWEPEHTSVL
jgi:spermidine/putrescine transport system ATP-binding protein